jgi:hypothetical protein
VIRRSFRIGLALGLLGGLAAALAKVFGTRTDPLLGAAPVPTGPWPRLDEPTVAHAEQPPPAVGAAPVVDARPPAAPVRKAPLKAADPPAKKAPKAAKPPTDAPAPVTKATAKKTSKKPTKSAKKVTAPPVAWVEPMGAVCPTTHPVKGKLGSLIFHLPGGLNYERTRPDRCYLDAAAAEADGLRPAKR